MHGAPLRGAHRTAHSSRLSVAGGVAGDIDGQTAPYNTLPVCLCVRTGIGVASHIATTIATARMAAMESGRMVGMRAANSIGI